MSIVDRGLCSALCTDRFLRVGRPFRSFGASQAGGGGRLEGSNLVDSASSHTLVSKIKPCMSKYKSCTLKLRMAHYISYSLFDSPLLLG